MCFGRLLSPVKEDHGQDIHIEHDHCRISKYHTCMCYARNEYHQISLLRGLLIKRRYCIKYQEQPDQPEEYLPVVIPHVKQQE